MLVQPRDRETYRFARSETNSAGLAFPTPSTVTLANAVSPTSRTTCILAKVCSSCFCWRAPSLTLPQLGYNYSLTLTDAPEGGGAHSGEDMDLLSRHEAGGAR